MKHALPLLAASLALAATGCSTISQNAPAPTVTQVEAIANDAFLTTEVKAKLITVDINSTASLGVHVSGGVATLTGAVRTARRPDENGGRRALGQGHHHRAR